MVSDRQFSESPAEFVMNDLTLEPMLFLLRVLASSSRVHTVLLNGLTVWDMETVA